MTDFNARNKSTKFLQQGAIHVGTCIINFERLSPNFIADTMYELVSKLNIGLKSLLHQGLSEPEFYGDLVNIN